MISLSFNFISQLFLCLLIFFSFFCVDGNNETPKESLPFCGLTESSNKYVFVSTLDGRVTALNPDAGGSVVWSIHPGSEPMLSSSIHKLELTNYGQFVRMIPSLSGGLYKFNGENIEAIPVTADHLLQASFRYSDDLVISGGKESHTFGVSLRSGRILYECSMKGCGNDSRSSNVGDILVIQRLGQIVRAVEPRTGSERWNFSVAQHDLKLLSECHGQSPTQINYELKVIVPEGLICAVDIKDSSKVLWKHKFDSPIVNAWQIQKGKLNDIDLFGGIPRGHDLAVSPSLYVGMHEKQLYIQESVLMQRKRQEVSAKFGQHLITNEHDYPRIPWKPVLVSRKSMGLIDQESDDPEKSNEISGNDEDKSLDEVDQRKTTALSVLYGSPYVEGNGFYLFTEEAIKKTEKGLCNVTIEPEEDKEVADMNGKGGNETEEETPVQIVIVSLWYWWREVLVISLTTAVLFNVMFTRRILSWKLSKPNEEKGLILYRDSDSVIGLHTEKIRKESESQFTQEYTSRYLADFDPVDCLGKGGFGVVFQAKNKIDDCHYAIKRITLPNRQESRERVMREVKALAKLDHHNIVRYFNAWTECPPTGWQEEQDSTWDVCNSDMCSTTEATSNQNSSVPLRHKKSSVFLNVDTTDDNDVSDIFSNHLESKRNDISDSYIVFDAGSERGEESLVTVNSEKESSIKSSDKVSQYQKPTRPTSLAIDHQSSLPSYSPNKVYLYIQMQLCQRQSLKDWLTVNKDRDYCYVLKIFEQILQAVEYVHLRGMIHRDLKPSNIFFSLDDQIKVGDFGLVTAMTESDGQNMSPCGSFKLNLENEKHTAQVGTQLYMSPEQLSGKPYNYKVDIYSLGLILFELLVPFNTQMERVHVLQDIKQSKFGESFQKKYKDEYELLKLMLSRCPDERPTTYGIKARPPLSQPTGEEAWHFELPMRRRGSSKTSQVSSSSSTEGYTDSR